MGLCFAEHLFTHLAKHRDIDRACAWGRTNHSRAWPARAGASEGRRAPWAGHRPARWHLEAATTRLDVSRSRRGMTASGGRRRGAPPKTGSPLLLTVRGGGPRLRRRRARPRGLIDDDRAVVVIGADLVGCGHRCRILAASQPTSRRGRRSSLAHGSALGGPRVNGPKASAPKLVLGCSRRSRRLGAAPWIAVTLKVALPRSGSTVTVASTRARGEPRGQPGAGGPTEVASSGGRLSPSRTMDFLTPRKVCGCYSYRMRMVPVGLMLLALLLPTAADAKSRFWKIAEVWAHYRLLGEQGCSDAEITRHRELDRRSPENLVGVRGFDVVGCDAVSTIKVRCEWKLPVSCYVWVMDMKKGWEIENSIIAYSKRKGRWFQSLERCEQDSDCRQGSMKCGPWSKSEFDRDSKYCTPR